MEIEQDEEKSGRLSDLEAHFVRNGLSNKAVDKIREDISSGDMNANILSKFKENELLQLANTYQMSILQRTCKLKAEN